MTIDPHHSPDPVARLLVSVQSIAEAQSIADLPVGILDFKNPTTGALGRCDPSTLDAGSTISHPGLSISAACGELSAATSDWQSLPEAFRFAKAGPGGLRTIESLAEALGQFAELVPSGTQPVAVAYADNARADSLPPENVLRSAIELGYRWFLIDTATKNGSSLLDWISGERLSRLLETCRSEGVRSVVAGSITLEQLPSLANHRPDLIGVRGAVCDDGRTSTIDPSRVADWCGRVLEHLGPLDVDAIGADAIPEQTR